MRMVSGSVALAAALPLARAAATIPQYVYDYGELKIIKQTNLGSISRVHPDFNSPKGLAIQHRRLPS